MKIIYVFDILCPWCYGFEHALSEFVKKHQELTFELVAGGLFTGDSIKPIREYEGMMKDVNGVEAIYPVDFSDRFKENLKSGTFMMDSNVPDHVFMLLRDHLDTTDQLQLIFKLQQKFFAQGCNMNEQAPYLEVLDELKLNASLKQMITDHFDERDDRDFKYAASLNVEHFPTLYLEKDEKLYDLKGNARTADELELNYRRLTKPLKLARP